MSEARLTDARGKVGQMREARSGRCARQGRADARGKVGQMREARPGRAVTKALRCKEGNCTGARYCEHGNESYYYDSTNGKKYLYCLDQCSKLKFEVSIYFLKAKQEHTVRKMKKVNEYFIY
jgi:hypothetical protein